MSPRGLSLSSGYSIVLPSNYIPWGGPGPMDAQQCLFSEAREKIKAIAAAVLQGEQHDVERGPLWQNIPFSLIYKISFQKVSKTDKHFWADDKCNHCRICAKVCPANNIEITDGKPRWLHRCEQCMACIQWCPQEAIQYGKKTVNYPRYHHPEVTLEDMFEQARTNQR
jgi:ferredoxin